jgi:hypothetical protein
MSPIGEMMSTIPDGISDIRAPCIPAEVAQVIVGWIVIPVASIHASRTWPNEGEQNELVN